MTTIGHLTLQSVIPDPVVPIPAIPDPEIPNPAIPASSVPSLPPIPAPQEIAASPVFPPADPPTKYPEDQPPRKDAPPTDSGFESVDTEGGEESTEPSEADVAMDRYFDTAEGVFQFESAGSAAYWPKNDANSTEYAHLTELEASSTFELEPKDIEAVIAANRFDPKGTRNASKSGCNLMPGGCYVSRIGTHKGGSIDPAIRTTDPPTLTADAEITVLRSKNDVAFGAQDVWDRCKPYDNTVRGRNEVSKQQFGKFQNVLKSLGGKERRADYLLLTGKEYALAAEARRQGDAEFVLKNMARLRTGSLGDEVTRLQQKLGFQGTGYFGASTKIALAEYQRSHDVLSDGIYSPTLDQQFGWGVFT